MWSGSRVPDARPDGWSEEDHFCTAWCLGSKARQHLSNVTLLFNRPLNLINLVPWLKQNFGDVIINFFGSAEFTGQYSMSKTIIIKELSCFPFRRVTHVNAAHGKLLGFSAVFFSAKSTADWCLQTPVSSYKNDVSTRVACGALPTDRVFDYACYHVLHK